MLYRQIWSSSQYRKCEYSAQVLEDALLPEPDSTTSEATSACAVRLPDGRRVARRLLRSAPLQQLFAFVDATVHAPNPS